MKKLVCVLMVLALVLGMSAMTAMAEGIAKEDIKVGFIYASAIGDEGYTFTHNRGRLALEEMGIETMYLENIPESSDCEKAARDLIDQGCNVIYAISFGHGPYIAAVAGEFPDVYFGHATGYMTADNLNTYMGRMYEAQFLAGIAAGMKTETGKVGIVTTFPIPEVVRQINSFCLGIRSVNPEATLEVKWTSSWYDPTTEKASATELLNNGCDVIAAYCDTMNPQLTAAEAGKFGIGCSSSGYEKIPENYLTAPLFNWGEYYCADVQSIIDGTRVGNTSVWGGMADGMVDIDVITDVCAEGTAEKVEEVKAMILDGTFDVWAGEIRDNEGNVRVAAGETLDDAALLAMDWLVEGVIGSIQ